MVFPLPASRSIDSTPAFVKGGAADVLLNVGGFLFV
jgi:hypothetical protein